MTEQVFWLVWNPESRQPPRYRHNSETSARAEAERLARKEPGQSFYVLRAVTVSRYRTVDTVQLSEDEIASILAEPTSAMGLPHSSDERGPVF